MKFITVMGTESSPHTGVIDLFEYHINPTHIEFIRYIGVYPFAFFDNTKPDVGPFCMVQFGSGASLFVNAMPTELIARGRS